MDWSTIIALVALVISVVSPFLTTVLSNRFKQRIRNQDFYDRHRAEVIESFIKSAGAFIKSSSSRETWAEFGANMGEIYLYTDESLWPSLDKLNELLRSHITVNNDLALCHQLLIHICKELAENPPRSKYQRRKKNVNR